MARPRLQRPYAPRIYTDRDPREGIAYYGPWPAPVKLHLRDEDIYRAKPAMKDAAALHSGESLEAYRK